MHGFVRFRNSRCTPHLAAWLPCVTPTTTPTTPPARPRLAVPARCPLTGLSDSKSSSATGSGLTCSRCRRPADCTIAAPSSSTATSCEVRGCARCACQEDLVVVPPPQDLDTLLLTARSASSASAINILLKRKPVLCRVDSNVVPTRIHAKYVPLPEESELRSPTRRQLTNQRRHLYSSEHLHTVPPELISISR